MYNSYTFSHFIIKLLASKHCKNSSQNLPLQLQSRPFLKLSCIHNILRTDTKIWNPHSIIFIYMTRRTEVRKRGYLIEMMEITINHFVALHWTPSPTLCGLMMIRIIVGWIAVRWRCVAYIWWGVCYCYHMLGLSEVRWLAGSLPEMEVLRQQGWRGWLVGKWWAWRLCESLSSGAVALAGAVEGFRLMVMLGE